MPVVVGLRAIKPRRSFLMLGRKIEQQLQSQAQASGREIKADFEKTTASWRHKVTFKLEVRDVGNSYHVRVSTDDEIYKFVNNGTRRHPIPKSGRAHLSFQWGGPGSYKAKTRPGMIGSGTGGATGPIVHRTHVMHPGTEARNFDLAIYERWQRSRRFKGDMDNAVRKAILGW